MPTTSPVPKPHTNGAAVQPALVEAGAFELYKRPFDLAVVALAIVLLLPLWAAVWLFVPLAIYLEDRRPIFHVQERLGRAGKTFPLIKFRTMVPDAEVRTGPVWATLDDTRTTRVGRALRRFHLDEIPQLINILRGDMSLVGPRPERPELARAFSRETPGFEDRLAVRPGIAGLAQAYGQHGYWTHPAEKLAYDRLYIERMGPFLDLKLIFLSLWVAFRRAFNERYVLAPAANQVGEGCQAGPADRATPPGAGAAHE